MIQKNDLISESDPNGISMKKALATVLQGF